MWTFYFNLSVFNQRKRDEIFRTGDRHSVEPVNLSKYVAAYEQVWKWMVEFLSEFQGRDIKIDKVNSIRSVKPWFSSVS